MKLKRFLAFVVSLAMVLSIVPAFSLTASAATNTYNATAFGHSGSASGTGIFVGTSETGKANGTKNGAPYINGTTTNRSGSGLGSSRIGYISFSVPKPATGEEVTSATMKLYVTSVNGNLGSSWMKMAAYRTTGTPSSVTVGNMNGDQYLAVNDDYSYNAGYWTNEQISSSNLGWKTIDVTDALNDAIAETDGDTVTLSFRLQTPTAGLNITTASTNAANQPVLEVKTAKKVDVTVNYVNANGQILATRVESAYTGDEFTVTNTVNDNYIIVDKTETEDGYVFDLVESETITVGESDNVVNVTVDTIYLIKSENLLPDGEAGLDSWTVGTSNGDNFATQPISGSSNTVTKSGDRAHSGDYSIKTASGWNSGTVNGWRGHTSIALYADVNPNSMYYFAGSVYMGNAAGTEATIATLTEAGNPLTMQGLTNGVKELANGGITSYNGTSTGDGAGNGKLFTGMNTKWNQLEYILTTDENSAGFAAMFYYLLDAGTSYFDDFMLYEIEVPATSKEVTATYTAGGKTVKTETKIVDTTVTDSATFGELYYSENGVNELYYTAGEALTESGTIVMQPVEHWGEYTVGDEFVKNNTPYKVTSNNLIPNGNFALGIEGWFAADGSKASASNFTTNAENGSVYLVGNGGSSSSVTLQRSWAVENGKTYAFVYTQSQTTTDRKWQRFSLGNTFASNNDAMLSGAGAGDVETGQSVEAGTNVVVFTNTAGYAYANFIAAWSGGVTLSNFGLYEVEIDSSKIANTTIKFVDSADGTTEIKESVTIEGVVGDVIDLAPYTVAITHGGNPYSFDDTNPASYTVVGNNDVVILTYTTDAYVSFSADTVTVIEGNDPIMPNTVTAVTGGGSTTEASGAVFADYTNLQAGTHTINGTVEIEGKTINGSVEVVVLPKTFETSSITGGGTANFPVEVTGDFYVEFDFNASNLDNMWIYISKDAALWGAGQIGLGWDADGNGYFRAQTAPQTDIQFETNKTYRFFVHGNVTNSDYDLVVYDTVTKEVIFTCTDYSFRTTGVSGINSIVASSNGEGGVADLTNIKVYAPDQADLFTTYTVVVTGSVTDEFTQQATSAEGVSIPYYEGNIVKTREVDGTTITLTYEETKTTLGSWAIRNNVTEQSWLTEMKYLGTHDAFADTDDVFRNDGGALYGDTGATSTSSTVINQSRAQTYGALDQLNMGVRYFDIRLSRQSDGSFATVHGPAFENFRDVAATIAQFAKENPGEVILLDFQTVRDALYTSPIANDTTYNGPDAGDDNRAVYEALIKLLTETGVMEFAAPANGWDKHYGEITNNGAKSVILLIGKARAYNCNNIFINRSNAIGGTYDSDISDYDDVVTNIENKIAAGAFGSGAKFGVVHAYTTPGGLGLLADSVIGMANENNPNWINENLDAWMTSGYGDVFLINNVTPEIAAIYLAQMSEYNRDDFDDIYSRNADGMEVNGVKLYAPTASVPFSTELTVDKTASAEVVVIDGVEYTYNAIYNIQLMQFDEVAVQPTGNVTLTFPKVSADATTVDALIYNGEVVYTANNEAISYETNVLGEYILATRVAPGREYTVNYVASGETIYTKTEVVPYGQVVYSVPAGDFYLTVDGKAYVLNSAEAVSHIATAEDAVTTFTVNVTIVTNNAVLSDTFANNDGSNDCNDTDNLLFVGSSGISDPGNTDADNAATMNRAENNVGSPRIPVLTFSVPEVAEGKAVKLHLYVAKANQNLGNNAMKLAVGTADLVVDEALGYKAADIANTTGIIWSDQMFTAVGDNIDGKFDVNSWVTVDVTEFVKAAEGDTITFTLYAPTAGAYVADREKTVAGGQYEGKAAYLEVVDTYEIAVNGASKITRNGNLVDSTDAVVAYEGAQIKLYETNANTPAFTNGTKVYATDNTTGETGYITVAGDEEYFAATTGVAPVDGAQVRIGYGVDADGKVGSESGLRFITTVDYTDSLANVAGAIFGVEITAEGSSAAPVVIPATKWQVEGEVFTAAITNLAEGNFNRKFTATPFVTVDGQTFYGTPVTRSIYQVAAGLLVNTDADGTDYDQSALESSVLYRVLNAYVNQTGIRLSVTSEGLTAYTGTGTSAYSGEQFFEVVSSETVSENVYAITIAPAGEKTTINSYWQEYIRINNNNSKIAEFTSMVDNGDGTVTITFDYASYLAQ